MEACRTKINRGGLNVRRAFTRRRSSLCPYTPGSEKEWRGVTWYRWKARSLESRLEDTRERILRDPRQIYARDTLSRPLRRVMRMCGVFKNRATWWQLCVKIFNPRTLSSWLFGRAFSLFHPFLSFPTTLANVTFLRSQKLREKFETDVIQCRVL